MVLIDIKVVSETAQCFFNIGSCLIEGKRKMIKRYNNIPCLIDLFIGSVLKALHPAKQKLCAFEETHCFYFDRGCQRTDSVGARSQQNAPITLLRKIVAYQSHIIGVIKDQQP